MIDFSNAGVSDCKTQKNKNGILIISDNACGCNVSCGISIVTVTGKKIKSVSGKFLVTV